MVVICIPFLNNTEKKYSQLDKEALGLCLIDVNIFYKYVFGWLFLSQRTTSRCLDCFKKGKQFPKWFLVEFNVRVGGLHVPPMIPGMHGRRMEMQVH